MNPQKTHDRHGNHIHCGECSATDAVVFFPEYDGYLCSDCQGTCDMCNDAPPVPGCGTYEVGPMCRPCGERVAA